MNQTIKEATIAERLVDNPNTSFSLRDVVSRVFLRPKLFLFSLLVPPLVAVMLASMVPVEWSASTKVLIRYSAADTGLLKGLVSSEKLGLSGATSAELIKSAPVLEKTIQTVGIQEQDIYKKPTDVIKSKLTGLFTSSDKQQSDSGKIKGVQAVDPGLVGLFQQSLQSSSKKSASADAVEILEKTSLVPEQLKLDELISLEVKSYNREKVANMANGLASAFIDEYYRLYAQEASQQAAYLDQLVKDGEIELARIQAATPADFAAGRAQINNGGSGLVAKDVPILASMAAQLTQVEAELTKASQIYAAESPQVSRLRTQLTKLKFLLQKQERVEMSKQLLEQLKSRRYQAQNTENIYKNRLVPINIAEYATEPGQSNSKKLMRLVIAGVVGSILGGILAISLTIILNVLDPRIHFKQDVESMISTPIIGLVSQLKGFRLSDWRQLKSNDTIAQDVWQIISKIGHHNTNNRAKVIAVFDPTQGSGASFCALALAVNLAKNKKQSTCLIDANFNDPEISRVIGLSSKVGLIELIEDHNRSVVGFDEPTGLHLIQAGNVKQIGELGYYANTAKALFTQLRSQYDYIVIDAGAMMNGNDALVFAGLADELLMVATSGQTRKGILRAAVDKLELAGLRATGLIFNQSKEVLPTLLYRLL
jgi:protein-tyrosine kinase